MKFLMPFKKSILRIFSIGFIAVFLCFTGIYLQVPKAIAQESANQLLEYAQFGNQTFGGLGGAPRGGDIAGIPDELRDQIGFDTARSWGAGAPISDIVSLGDIGQSFYAQAFSLSDIANITGIDAGGVSLSDFSLIQNQSLSSISALAGLDNFRLEEVPALQEIFNSSVLPGLEAIAGQSGDLPLGIVDPQAFIEETLADYGQQAIGELIRMPDQFSGLSFGDISLGDAPDDILKDFSIADIPGLDKAAIGNFKGWEDLAISDVPGLDQVPFGDFPNPIAAITGGIGGTHDVTYGTKEHTETETKYAITGSDQEGFSVQCAQDKGCMYLELAGSGKMHGAQWIAGGSGEGQQMVKGGSGLLAVVNGGQEPTGRVPFGDVFKIVLTDVDESSGTGSFALYMRYCQRSMFVNLGCTPYFIGPIPIWGSSEKGFVLTGPLDGSGGASGGLAVPPELQQYASRNLGGGSYYGSGGSPISMDEDCLDALIGALRHSNEAAGAREHIPRIIAAANEFGVTDRAQLAYILGTISTELEGIWRPTGERGVGCGTYGPGCFYGRGFVQLTHEENYQRLGDLLGVDLVNNPERANEPDLAARITVLGMRDGLFTGRSLGEYIGDGRANFIGARRIVNDGDKMVFTAYQAERFLEALNSCSTLETQRGVPAGDINAAIVDSMNRNHGMNTAGIPGTDGGRWACAGSVNYILNDAGIAPLGGPPPYGSLSVLQVERAIQGGRGTQVNTSEAQPGDLNIIDMGGSDQHIGICLNVGCTRVMSNSSSRAAFLWESDGWFNPSYGGGRRAIYRVTN